MSKTAGSPKGDQAFVGYGRRYGPRRQKGAGGTRISVISSRAARSSFDGGFVIEAKSYSKERGKQTR